MPLYVPLIVPQGGALNAIDQSGVEFPAFYVESNNHVAFQTPPSGNFDFVDENSNSIGFASSGVGIGVAPACAFLGSDVSFNSNNILWVSSTNGHTILQAHPTGAVVDIVDSSGNVIFSTAQSATTPDPGANGTISTTGIGVARVTPTASRTGVILQAGVTPAQEVTVVNNSGSFTITFAAVGTSHVADGVSAVIAANRKMDFTWDSVASKWYHS